MPMAPRDFALGTWRHDGDAGTPLTADRWNLEALETWTSPETGSPYPVRWKLSVPGQDGPLLIEALFPEQENVSTRTGIHYWEGAVQVRVWPDGAVLGRGFVELTGYGSGSRPPI